MTKKSVDIGSALSNAFAVPVEEDSAPVNVLAGALGKPAGVRKQGELDEAPNLLAVRAAVLGLRDGSITPEDYFESISAVHLQISELIGLFEMPQVQRELAKASQLDQDLAERTRQGLEVVEQGLVRLVNYLESQDGADLDEGLALVESGYLDLDRTQDDALLEIEEDEDDDEDEEDD
ncbi:MAG: hypothetical protein U0931_10610 [Vulcanimicrobiota bacterium]